MSPYVLTCNLGFERQGLETLDLWDFSLPLIYFYKDSGR
jgi:hypothetical protein